mmetsp:Transcript_17451/g.37684  ORF Transcript_17451/g.37684 Transcript_17451/m.37684 type:complete len:80 (+) Transcript_17451:317-556(+)
MVNSWEQLRVGASEQVIQTEEARGAHGRYHAVVDSTLTRSSCARISPTMTKPATVLNRKCPFFSGQIGKISSSSQRLFC